MRFRGVQLNPKLLGARIREARERLGLSQDQLAELVSKDQAAISAYENGKRKLAAVDLPSFANVLQMPLLYFFEGDVSPDDLDRAALQELHKLPTLEARRSLVEVIRILGEALNLHYRK